MCRDLNMSELGIFVKFRKYDRVLTMHNKPVARYLLEGGSKSSKMSATMVLQRRKFWVAKQLKR